MKKHIDRQTIIDEISKNNCYKSEYAKHLNISLYTFNALLKRYKIDISLYN